MAQSYDRARRSAESWLIPMHTSEGEPRYIALALFEVDHEALLVSVFAPTSSAIEVRITESESGAIRAQETLVVDQESGLAAGDFCGLLPSVSYLLAASRSSKSAHWPEGSSKR